MVVRLGLLGFGNIAREHIEAVNYIDGLSLSGILECDEAKRPRAEELDIPFYIKSEREIFLKNADALIIATPPHLHADQAIRLMEEGKSVLCEKPMATNLEDALEMVETSKRLGRVLRIASHSRYNPRIQELISNPRKHGEILGIEVDFLEDIGDYHDSDWVFNREEAGGGCIIDSGINALDAITSVVGPIEIKEVTGNYGDKAGKKREIEMEAHISFTFNHGRKGIINLSSIADQEKRTITFKTPSGKHTVNYLIPFSKGPRIDFVREYRGVLQDFLDCIIKKDKRGEEGYSALSLVFDCYKKLQQQDF